MSCLNVEKDPDKDAFPALTALHGLVTDSDGEAKRCQLQSVWSLSQYNRDQTCLIYQDVELWREQTKSCVGSGIYQMTTTQDEPGRF